MPLQVLRLTAAAACFCWANSTGIFRHMKGQRSPELCSLVPLPLGEHKL